MEESSPDQLCKGLPTSNLMIVVSGSTRPDQNFYIDIFANEISNLFGLSFEMIYTPVSVMDPLTAEMGTGNLMGSDVIFSRLSTKRRGWIQGR